NRSTDTDCNPYLESSEMLAGGLDGIDRKIDPGPMNKGNMYRTTDKDLEERGIELLPGSLKEAVDEFQRDRVSLDALGKEFAEYYAKMKMKERNEYNRTVSQSEVDRYLTYL